MGHFRNISSHGIDTGDARLVNKNPRPLSSQQLKEQMNQVESILKRGLIRESTSPRGAPVFFVAKKTLGEWRMCIDYRALNSLTIKNTYPLPRIQECTDKLGKASHLSSIDMVSGYWQLGVLGKDVRHSIPGMGNMNFWLCTYNFPGPACFGLILVRSVK
jgi:hypothetical protein